MTSKKVKIRDHAWQRSLIKSTMIGIYGFATHYVFEKKIGAFTAMYKISLHMDIQVIGFRSWRLPSAYTYTYNHWGVWGTSYPTLTCGF